jgi:hypothetical protein
LTGSEEIDAFVHGLEGRRKQDAPILDALFRQATGFEPRLYGKIIGYGRYAYTYASGRSGTSFATGFAPAKARIALHIMPGYNDFPDILPRLGKFKRGKSCFYVNKLEDVDLSVLEELVVAGLEDLRGQWPVTPD